MTDGHRSELTIAIGDDHVALADALRVFLEKRCTREVVRQAVDKADRGQPGFATEMSELGWLGLPIPEGWGGQGFGCSEAVLVVEALARAMAPGPFLPTTVAGLLLRIAATHRANTVLTDALGALARGEISAAVAREQASTAQKAQSEVSDCVAFAPTFCAGEAGLFVIPVPAQPGEDERWALVNAEQFEVESNTPLDLTRGIATMRCTEFVVTDERLLLGVDRDLVDAAWATFAAAECAGITAWCVDTAATYARQRHQFGRPIGQFQAVKHRCADMLIACQAVHGVAWDAATAADRYLVALDGDVDETQRDSSRLEWMLAAACAASVALDAAVRVAEDCIQVLGGIGFTWEHDAHLYLRRAVALRQQLGGASRWRRKVSDLGLAGTRRRLHVALPDDDEAQARRGVIHKQVAALAELEGDDQRTELVASGYLVPHWPKPWGIDADALTQLLIDDELRQAKVRRPHLQVGAWAAPTIAAHGTPEQQQRWVKPTLLGTTSWCQLFSEPEAGSDLAGLRTRATRVEGGWSVTGQKVWTTMAREAQWGICLVRTDPDAPKHAGITYLIVDMTSPGIEIRPLKEMTGLEMFNEVFFTDVFVPDDCVIGDVNGGWALARTTLGNERVSMGSGSSFGGGVENLLRLINQQRGEGQCHDAQGGLDPIVADQLGALIAEAHAVATLGARTTLRSVSGAKPGAEASVRKLLGVEHDQRVQAFGLSLLGPAGAMVDGDAAMWTFGYLANRCLTIAGGTSEIQRNVIGERLLGLPRDVEPEGQN